MPAAIVSPNSVPVRYPGLRPLLEHFAQVPDPRSARGRIHRLPVILGLVAFAVVGKHTTPTEISEWAGEASQELLAELGARWDGWSGRYLAPGKDTVTRVLAGLDADVLDCVICRFIARMAEAHHAPEPTPTPTAKSGLRRHYAFDGKVLRGSRGNGYRAEQLVAVYDVGLGTVVAQRAVAHKSNEIPAAPKLLATVKIAGAVVTGDSLHTHDALARCLRRRRAHYVLTVKRNRPKLHEAITAAFTDPAAKITDTSCASERGHGLLSVRKVEVIDIASLPRAKRPKFPGAKQIARITRWRCDLATGLPLAKETAYLVTSLTAHQADAEQIGHYIRRHWAIENELHYVRDTALGEDACKASTGNLPRVLATFRNLAISALRLAGHTNIAAGLRKYARNPQLVPALLHLTKPDTHPEQPPT